MDKRLLIKEVQFFSKAVKNSLLRHDYGPSPRYLHLLKAQFNAFKLAVLAALFFGAFCILIYVCRMALPLDLLMTSARTPWGIVTSLVIHPEAQHLLANMAGLAAYSALFVATNLLIPNKEKKQRSILLLKATFLIAVAVNVVWAVLVPYAPAAGSSGVVYALQGVVLGFCLINLLTLKDLLRSGCQKWWSMLARVYVYMLNAIIFLFCFLQVLVQPGEFLSLGLSVNIFVHGAAFLGGFFTAVIWTLSKKLLKRDLNKFSIEQLASLSG